MRILIDGYNLMFEGGVLRKGARLGPDGLRKVRQRFLNDLAEALGPVDAHQTTVVFDASRAPEDRPSTTPHKGIWVIFAVDTDDADERIEQLIAKHSHPRGLTVVSTDRRVRQAAARRKARSVTCDAFWSELDDRRAARARAQDRPRNDDARPASGPSSEEAEYWAREFADLDELPETREALSPDSVMLTDEEIARLEREIDREFP